jgi:hypothetical protein
VLDLLRLPIVAKAGRKALEISGPFLYFALQQPNVKPLVLNLIRAKAIGRVYQGGIKCSSDPCGLTTFKKQGPYSATLRRYTPMTRSVV